ncbi:HNH endonuclease [Streptomyces sp. NPDC015125]|uniref:HNH endonuclease n=1 Tax=Streptomyces sp. NPDC015125 TaxID=3364938 RepID=UPI0036FDE982
MHNQDVRRMRRRGLPMERISRAEIFKRDGMLCHLCGMPITGKPTIDHVIPIATPGSPGHVWENLAAAHSACNSSKRDRVREADWVLYRQLRERRLADAGCSAPASAA